MAVLNVRPMSADAVVDINDAAGSGRLVSASDEALALEFTKRHGDELRYTAKWGQWIGWDGTCWRPDETLSVFDRVRRVCRDVAANHHNKPKIQAAITSASTVYAVERLARADRKHAATVDQWDANSTILNTPAGIVDLMTEELLPSDPTDYCTKMTAVGLGLECPKFDKFLNDITDRNVALVAYLQRVIGYAITGSTKEHALFFLYGTGLEARPPTNCQQVLIVFARLELSLAIKQGASHGQGGRWRSRAASVRVYGDLSSVVPVPAALPLLLSGLLGLGAVGWRRRKAA